MTIDVVLILAALAATFLLASLVIVERNTRHDVRSSFDVERDADTEWFDDLTAHHELARRHLEAVAESEMSRIIDR